jgi:hypothetical protein
VKEKKKKATAKESAAAAADDTEAAGSNEQGASSTTTATTASTPAPKKELTETQKKIRAIEKDLKAAIQGLEEDLRSKKKQLEAEFRTDREVLEQSTLCNAMSCKYDCCSDTDAWLTTWLSFREDEGKARGRSGSKEKRNLRKRIVAEHGRVMTSFGHGGRWLCGRVSVAATAQIVRSFSTIQNIICSNKLYSSVVSHKLDLGRFSLDFW